VQEVVDYLRNHNATEIIEISGAKENVRFPIPKPLR
jgi:hypothetical protein